MKRNRRILSLLLAICLVIAMAPAVFAADNAVIAEQAEDDQIVSFAGKEWIVIDSNSTEIVLLLKTPEAPIAYTASGLSNSWDVSDAKAWCESEAVRKWFSNAEWNALSSDKVYFLSHDEVVTYWVDNSADSLKTENGWWLRYVDENVDSALFGLAISDAGFMGTPHVAANYGARPAIKIPVEKIAALIQPEGQTVWQLKVVDDNFASDFTAEVAVGEDTVTVTYSGAAANSTVYAILCDRLGQTISYVSNAGGGNIELSLPEKPVGWYSVRVFNEVNGVAGTSAVKVHDFSINDGKGNVVEWNVNVGGDISANFNIELSDSVKADENAKVTVTHNGVTKEILVTDLIPGTASDGETECVKLPVDLNAPQMTDQITIQVISSEGEGGQQTFTIKEYAEAIINGNFSDETKDLVKHMLNYGAKAQTYFNYKTNNLATSGIDVPQLEQVPVIPEGEKLPAVQSGSIDGIKFYGTSLVLNSQTTLRFYYELVGDAKIADYTFTYNSEVLKAQGKSNGGKMLYFVDVIDIAPDQLNNDFTVTVSCDNGNLNVGYNPMWYIQKQYYSESNAMKFKNLLQAMYNYYRAAVAYAK